MLNNKIKGCVFLLVVFMIITTVNATDNLVDETNPTVDTIST